MKITVVKRSKKTNRFGARKYTRVPSETDGRKSYDVAKVRVLGKKYYRYVCTCKDFLYRQKPCKHIAQFKQEEF